MIWFFYFQDTYNNRLKKRYGDNYSTYPDFDSDLWLEVGSSGGANRIQVYGLSSTKVENLWIARGVSTLGSSKSVSSTQSLKFATLLDQGVEEHTTHLHEKYKRRSADYEELHLMIMSIKSYIDGWYICILLLALRSRERLVSSSFSVPFVLVSLYLNV
jgi:hypothetical protein